MSTYPGVVVIFKHLRLSSMSVVARHNSALLILRTTWVCEIKFVRNHDPNTDQGIYINGTLVFVMQLIDAVIK